MGPEVFYILSPSFFFFCLENVSAIDLITVEIYTFKSFFNSRIEPHSDNYDFN